jgi:hypothetical protein
VPLFNFFSKQPEHKAAAEPSAEPAREACDLEPTNQPSLSPKLFFRLKRDMRKRLWNKCYPIIDRIETLEPLTAAYWRLLIKDTLLRQPLLEEWRALHEQCHAAQLAPEARPAFDVFCGFVNALIKAGRTEEIRQQWPYYARRYGIPCPAESVPGICFALIGSGHFQECLTFLDDVSATQKDELEKPLSHMRAYLFRYVCLRELGQIPASAEANPISSALLKELAKMPINAMRQPILQAFYDCSGSIARTGAKQLLDIRFDTQQAQQLRAMVQEKLSQREAFSLLRIGDADSYGMRDVLPEAYAKLKEDADITWWKKPLEADVRQKLEEGFMATLKEADIIGFPAAIRLVRHLRFTHEEPLILPEQRQLFLYQAMKVLIDEGKTRNDALWADEFCNISLADSNYLSELFELAESVVLVSCFDIPDGHLFAHPKVTQVRIPPPERASGFCPNPFNKVLPDMIDEVVQKVEQLCRPGTLLLVSGGYASKLLVGIGRAAGAVAIDFGSGIDTMLAHHTRPFAFKIKGNNPAVASVPYIRNTPSGLIIELEDLSREEGLNWRPLYIAERQRFATATSVKLIDKNTLVCTSLLGRKIYLIRFDVDAGTYQVLDCIDTTLDGQKIETDLCDLDGQGHIATSNCGSDSFTLYKHVQGKLHHVRDLPVKRKTYMHGVKFYTPEIIVGASTRKPMGVHFYDIATMTPLLYMPTPIRTKDVTFLSASRMAVILVYATATTAERDTYRSEVQLVDFNLASKTYQVAASTIIEGNHVDCIHAHAGRLYTNLQYTSDVLVLDANTLKEVGTIKGYDFPHGVDVNYGLLAVSDYGRNCIDLRRLDSVELQTAT